MSDAHRPFWTSISIRLRAALFLLLIMIVAAVVGLVERSGGSSTGAAHRPAGAAVPVDDRASVSGPAPSSSAPTVVTSAPAARPTGAATRSTTHAQHAGAPRPAPTAPLTYVVKPGDNLTVIAAWFHLHGYGNLYERNRAIIGDDPNLIFPGQRITLSGAGVSMSMTASR